MSSQDAYQGLIDLLDAKGARYRLIDHPAEGRTDIVSPMRGNELGQAAKCMIVMVKLGKKVTKYVLAVIPGDRKVDLNAIKRLLGGSYISFASPDIAERLAGCVVGTVLPISFDPDLELIVDGELLSRNSEIYFNAARLDRSMALDAQDYAAIAKPRIEKIAQPV
jgi:Ala-tRNA(Pro) deacylase